MEERKIKDVTFFLREIAATGSIGIAKEIGQAYAAPADASHYRYVRVDDYHIFIARQINILGPLTLTTEGLWSWKRLCLAGSNVPL